MIVLCYIVMVSENELIKLPQAISVAPRNIDFFKVKIEPLFKEEGEEKLHLLMVDDHIPAGAKLY